MRGTAAGTWRDGRQHGRVNDAPPRYARADVLGPRLALLPGSDGKIGGAALTLALCF